MEIQSDEILRYRSVVDTQLAAYHHAKSQLKQEKRAWQSAETHDRHLQEALTVAQAVAQQTQEKAHSQIGEVVSRALKTVFEDEDLTFKIIFEQKRGRTEARLVFLKDGLELDPMSSSGGGVVDVAALALRIGVLLLARPPVRRVLVLDEPCKFVSKGYRPKVRMLLQALAKDLELQLIMVTHDAELVTGKVHQIG